MPPSLEFKARLAEARAAFRAEMEKAGAAAVWNNFAGRIAAVLSGGGARGAYEAGALLAFQDAGVPTHIIAATSVGSINAASYAARSEGYVGHAESLVETWFGLSPTAVGIEWTRYLFMLIGLLAAVAGFGKLILYLVAPNGLGVHLHDPAVTWLALGLAGGAVLLFYDDLPYLGHIIANFLGRSVWKPDPWKAARSLLANAIVWGFVLFLFHTLHLHQPTAITLLAAALVLAAWFRRWLSQPVSIWLHQFLRLPLRAGLFPNFERTRLLRRRIPVERLSATPIRLVFTLTDLESGTARFFSNTPPNQLAADRGADARFVAEEVDSTPDLLRAVIASSALPIVYEPIKLDERLYTDGGIITNQPIRPAIRLGADVLFLVMVETPGAHRGELKTFIDVGLRALDVLMLQYLLSDLRILTNVNALCEQAAAELGLRPEEIEIDFGSRRYRYVKAFTIRPAAPPSASTLDFGAETTAPAILQGYLDAAEQVRNSLAWAPQTRFGRPRRLLRFTAADRNVPSCS